MGLKNVPAFDDLQPDSPVSSPASPVGGLREVPAFDDMVADTPHVQGRQIKKRDDFNWYEPFTRPFSQLMDRHINPTIEGGKVWAATQLTPDLDAYDPLGSDGGRALRIAEELREDPANDINRKAVQAMGINPDDLLSGDFNVAGKARYLLTNKLRGVRLANSNFVKTALQKGQDARDRYAENAPDYGDDAVGTSMQFVEDILSGTVDMIPSIVATYAAGPAVGAMPMAARMLGNSTLENYNDYNLSPDAANARAIYQTATEYFPTILGLKVFKDGGGTVLQKILKSTGAEGFEESLTELFQSGGDDYAGLEDLTLEEYLKRMAYSGAVGAGVGATMRTPIALIEGDDPPTSTPGNPEITPKVTPQQGAGLRQAPTLGDFEVDIGDAGPDIGLRTVQPGETRPVTPMPFGPEPVPEDPTFEQLMQRPAEPSGQNFEPMSAPENRTDTTDTTNSIDVEPAPEPVIQQALTELKAAEPSDPATIETIANDPDYKQTGYSRDLTTGAPVIEASADIPAEQIGITDSVSLADGSSVRMQYAVVEAEQLLPANDSAGVPSAEFTSGTPGRMRVIGGNARAAGLVESYNRGTAGQYVAGMTADTLHGVPAEAIEGMTNPVLVRLMPTGSVSQSVVDQRNTAPPQVKPAKVRKKVAVTGRDSLMTAIAKLGGISKEWQQDITGDTTINRLVGGAGPVFRATGGVSPDSMAAKLIEAGFLTGDNYDTVATDKAVKELYELLKQELNGGKKRFAFNSEGEQRQVDQDAEAELDTQIQAYEASGNGMYDEIARLHGQEAADKARFHDEAMTAYNAALDDEIELAIQDEYDTEQTAIAAADAARDRESEGQTAGTESRPEGESTSQAPEDFSLNTQTETDLRNASQAQQENRQRLAKENEKAAADDALPGFTLTGSTSITDEAEARGQTNLFDSASRTTPQQDSAAPAVERSSIDAAAHQAATSPDNDLPEPTQAQKEAGNYRKGHFNWEGFDISIENPKGSARTGTDPDGRKWERELSNHYGYIRRTEGADGEQVDVFVGPFERSNKIFVIDQLNRDGSFDEHKVMLGFKTLSAAKKAYASNYDPDWTVGNITELDVKAFKEWLRNGDTTKPLSSSPPLSSISIKRTYTVEGTNKTVKVDMPADQATEMLAGEINTVKRLIRCLTGAM